jgi:hypothetical protein
MLRGSIFASVIAASAGLLSLAPTTARADTMIFDLTLTPVFGHLGGTGVVTIVAPSPGTSGFDTGANGRLLSMTFTLSNGDVFDLQNATVAGVGFHSSHGQEVVNDFVYVGSINNYAFDLQINGRTFTYTFENLKNPKDDTIGTFTAVDPPADEPPSAVPSPIVGAGLPGLLIGGIGLLAFRRARRGAATT